MGVILMLFAPKEDNFAANCHFLARLVISSMSGDLSPAVIV